MMFLRIKANLFPFFLSSLFLEIFVHVIWLPEVTFSAAEVPDVMAGGCGGL